MAEDGTNSAPGTERFEAADLFEAAASGGSTRVNEILVRQPELAVAESPKPRGPYWVEKPIHVAAANGHVEVVVGLLRAGAHPLAEFQPFTHVHCDLTLACDGGHLPVVKAIEAHLAEQVRQEPDVVRRADTQGNTLLHLAAYHRRAGLANELLARGAEFDLANHWGQRPLHLALYYDWNGGSDLALAREFVKRGAATDAWVGSALGDIDMVQASLDREASQANTPIGPGPAPGGARYPLAMAALGGHAEIVRLLLDCGADPDAPNLYSLGEVRDYEESGVPLLFAISRGHFDVALILLERGANADAPPIESGPSPMDAALASGNQDLINRMVVAGGRPGIHAYVESRNYLVVGELLDRSADSPDGDFRTVGQNLLHIAAWLGEPNVVRMCLRRKPAVSTGEGLGLLWSTMRTHNLLGDADDYLTVAKLLLEYGIRPHKPKGDTERRWHGAPADSSPLHWLSIARGRIEGNKTCMLEYAELLIQYGAEVNAIDGETGATPLGWAARYGHTSLVRRLLEHGADASLPAHDSSATPLAWAVKNGHREIQRMLSSR